MRTATTVAGRTNQSFFGRPALAADGLCVCDGLGALHRTHPHCFTKKGMASTGNRGNLVMGTKSNACLPQTSSLSGCPDTRLLFSLLPHLPAFSRPSGMAGNGMKSAFAKDDTQARKDVATSVSVVATLIGSTYRQANRRESCLQITVTFVVLRIYTRAFIIRNMGVEDWTMISAATLTIIFLSLFIVGINKFGVGSHIQWVTAQQAVSGVKVRASSLSLPRNKN